MKKIFALLLAIVMVMGLATVASAETPADPNYTDNVTSSSSTTNIKLNKLYQISGAVNVTGSEADESAKVYPDETLKFVSTPNEANPTDQNITIADLKVTGTTGEMAITLPEYKEIGKYIYTVTETAGTAKAATYAKDAIELTVLVTYNENHTALEAELILTQKTAGNDTIISDGKTKVDTFVNKYEVGQLDVKKTVKGNLASQEEEFEMTVKFTSDKPVLSDITVKDGSTEGEAAITTIAHGTGWKEYTATIHVKHGETVSFYNIPTGVSYVVEENAKHGEGEDGFDPNSADDTDYTIEYDNAKNGTISTTKSETTVTNTKNTSVETGIVMDSVPFVVMAVIAVLGLAAFTAKKRVQE